MTRPETEVLDYIRRKTEETQDGIRLPLSHIADELNLSTSTTWRMIQKLKEKNMIKVVKSHDRTKPDIIYYVGNSDDVTELIDGITNRLYGVLVMLNELKVRLKR